jgi:hypothetical protein
VGSGRAEHGRVKKAAEGNSLNAFVHRSQINHHSADGAHRRHADVGLIRLAPGNFYTGEKRFHPPLKKICVKNMD